VVLPAIDYFHKIHGRVFRGGRTMKKNLKGYGQIPGKTEPQGTRLLYSVKHSNRRRKVKINGRGENEVAWDFL